MRLRNGVCVALEEAADALLREDLKGVPPAQHDVLTPWKERSRRSHELYVASGVPDAAIRSGIYHRAINTARPELNSREGVARARNSGAAPSPRFSGTLAQWVHDHAAPEQE
jgi:hypothetical protein